MSTCTDTCCRPEQEDGSEWQRISQTGRKARVAHTCRDCGGAIAAGSRYVLSVYVGDGIQADKTHTAAGHCIPWE